MSLHQKTLSEIAAGLKAREFSSVEVTQHYLGRDNQRNEELR